MARKGKLKVSKVADGSSWSELKPKDSGASKKRGDAAGKRQRSQSDHAKQKRQEHRRNRRLRSKEKQATCFGCRKEGHTLENCPEAKGGVCFRCGETDHTTAKCKVNLPYGAPEYPYATCFICKESGHLSKSCPENPLGLYPNGGGCAFCASVEHFKRDCPDRKANSKGKPRWKINLSTASGSADADDAIVLDDPADHGNSDDEAGGLVPPKPKAKKKKVVSF